MPAAACQRQMTTQEVDTSAIPFFSLRSTVLSHGWVNLDPFSWNDRDGVLSLPISCGSSVYHGTLSSGVNSGMLVFRSSSEIAPEDRSCLRTSLHRMLSLGQDIPGLISMCRGAGQAEYLKLLRKGWGRIFRAQSAWEDAAKTVFTTNASWSFTRKMCRSMCQHLGRGGAFPEPEAVAGQSEDCLRNSLKLGYRSPYIIELADRISSGALDLESLEAGKCDRDTAEKTVRGIRGLGPYGANHLLVMLGWHEYLPVDREVMKFLGIRQKRPNEKCPRNTEHYLEWGRYRFIAYKLDRIARRQNWIGSE